MTDLLVKLYDLPEIAEQVNDPSAANVRVNRALAFDRPEILAFVREHFNHRGWLGEVESVMARQPTTCYIAVISNRIAGFACYDGTAKGFFGPFGVAPMHQKLGIGRRLLFSVLRAMAYDGYGYAIVGWASDPEWYQRTCGAIPIPDSTPGLYQQLIKP